VIVKECAEKISASKFEKAGLKAEKQMAFYLKREFAKDKDIFVFNDLRIIHDGEVAQIDHFVLHKCGFALIESKSITGSVEINKYGEWVRRFDNKPTGMRSPVIQLEMQQKILINKLEVNVSILLGTLIGLRKHFGGRSYDRIVAISDQGRIVRRQKTENVHKADMVAGLLRKRIKQYKRELITGDSVWFTRKEMEAIRQFLLNECCERIKYNDEKASDLVTNKSVACEQEAVAQKTIGDYWHCRCGKNFEIRHKHSFYRYCPDCRRILKLSSVCPVCKNKATLTQPDNTRIITYQCESTPEHHGVFYTNHERYKKDEHTLKG